MDDYCETCRGDGLVKGKTCPTCQGTGTTTEGVT